MVCRIIEFCDRDIINDSAPADVGGDGPTAEFESGGGADGREGHAFSKLTYIACAHRAGSRLRSESVIEFLPGLTFTGTSHNSEVLLKKVAVIT